MVPGSGKNPFRIPDPGVKMAPDPGSGYETLIKYLLAENNSFYVLRREFCQSDNIYFNTREGLSHMGSSVVEFVREGRK